MHNAQYHTDPKFEELLTSCGSMTAQLKQLHYDFSVELLEQKLSEDKFYRTTLLKLNNTPVIIAQSSCLITDDIFYNIIKDADTTPIGKYLFAPNSQITRTEFELKQTQPHELKVNQATLSYLSNQHIKSHSFWVRTSMFSFKNQQMDLIEIILPNICDFFDDKFKV